MSFGVLLGIVTLGAKTISVMAVFEGCVEKVEREEEIVV